MPGALVKAIARRPPQPWLSAAVSQAVFREHAVFLLINALDAGL